MFKTNHYFDGKVTSIAFQTETLPATVGVMAQGDYEFGTSQKEYMTVTSGSLTVKLPGADNWVTFKQGETFTVEANQTFQVKADVESAYLCLYE
ncbi:pyrimidine/purine nucleoside phosphorylase [Aestuariicella hydrocarbonica]|uniref:Pyrimidine/purine nucleoside phosphorylase n=1 Tax=Pseudomaricurvus hydrocarbonicus TaxID=1470433 RepID=A0A9E5JRW0_9GAMM|nr:pyrimidine/purine nucleoside phosphorylase [Aestuariicella hydrocarbonica]NHO65399.1 pyrimidine/purine nucleoside phosphorylase [Aestuariicella hydrocarbonica]